MKRAALLLWIIVLSASAAFAGITASITGIVKDKTGAVVVGAPVNVINAETGIRTATQTNADGFYSFPALPIGHYDLQVQAPGFSAFEEKGLVLDVNTALRVDATLQVSNTVEKVEVSGGATAQVETQSTQMGELIDGKEMTTLPLNGRDYTELMALQPGVVPSTADWTGGYNLGKSGGQLSISGGRETANGFMVNGGSVQESMANGSSVSPNLDSIAEFRILTNNFDAEYGHYSGGIVNVVTKSGTNQYHGDAFEFVRNTGLDARNYYSLERNDYRHNQFGGTFGGPILRSKLFFFSDYEARRVVQGGSGFTAVPSAEERSGDLSTQTQFLTGTVVGPSFAQSLSQKLGYPVSVGEPFYSGGCTSGNCVFPNAVIPQAAISPLAANLLKFVPLPNVPASSNFPTGAYANSGASSNSTTRDDKGGIRNDFTSRLGTLSGYYHIDDYSSLNPDAFTVGAIGSTASEGRSQLITLGDTKTIGSSSLNELQLSFMRNAAGSGVPTGKSFETADLESLGFTMGCDTLGICPISPFKALPSISTNNFGFGGPVSAATLHENVYQVSDGYSRTIGTHMLKFGGVYLLNQSNWSLNEGGTSFQFSGSTETGSDFADYLLGAPSAFSQGQAMPMYDRARYYGVYGQDSWRFRPALTLNYGLRWDVSTPWWEKYNRNFALIPGRESVTFPGAPTGWVFPGEPGVPSTVAPTQYNNLAPRIGLAYSPDLKGGIGEKLTGGAGKTSIRVSWGMFYGALEDWTNANENGDAPYGLWWQAPTPEQFSTPFVDLYTGNSEGQRFPMPSNIVNASPSHPDPNLDWTRFEPISSSPAFYNQNVTPYTENYMLSVQRSLANDTVLTVSYVGSQGHHLLVLQEANPATPSVCLSVSQQDQVAPGSNTCGPFSETGTFTTAAGQVIEARQQLGPNGGTQFGSDGFFKTIGNSTYNALEGSVRHTVGRLSLLGSYTYGKSMDIASTASDQVYPFDPSRSRALSGFDITHNFVASYSYELPFDKAYGHNRLAGGWIVSGITRFTTGLPVTVIETDDRSLIGNTSPGPTGSQDEPKYTLGKLLSDTNPRHGATYFNTSLFTQEDLGQFGNAKRRFFHGPGNNNWDLALMKNLPLKESKTLEFRFELFNAFNHAQFGNPNGNIDSSTFGVVTGAGDPRIGQASAKFIF